MLYGTSRKSLEEMDVDFKNPHLPPRPHNRCEVATHLPERVGWPNAVQGRLAELSCLLWTAQQPQIWISTSERLQLSSHTLHIPLTLSSHSAHNSGHSCLTSVAPFEALRKDAARRLSRTALPAFPDRSSSQPRTMEAKCRAHLRCLRVGRSRAREMRYAYQNIMVLSNGLTRQGYSEKDGSRPQQEGSHRSRRSSTKHSQSPSWYCTGPEAQPSSTNQALNNRG